MNIKSFKNHSYVQLFEKDNTERDIGYSHLTDVIITGRNNYYPNTLLYSANEMLLISPYDEKIMSLNKESFYDNNIYDLLPETSSIINKNEFKEFKGFKEPLFFFIYNFDNYYHFLYDTLPYLFTYIYLKKSMPNIRLLVNYPNKNMLNFYRFNTDFLEKIIDVKNDLVICDGETMYSSVYISSSLTHGGYSNNPPRREIYQIYDIIKNNINIGNIRNCYLTKNLDKIYISRRTWINKDKSNIGTDYTTRRKMMNEDELVEKMKTEYDIVEIFAENLNTDEKVYLFANAKLIIGSIGGGMANLLFSKPTTKTVVIVTPYFLDINYRFKYSLENTDITYFNDVETYKEMNIIPLYCRVKVIGNGNYNEKIGEITSYDKDTNKYLINLSNNDIAGFNNSVEYTSVALNNEDFILLDNGLNSPYTVKINILNIFRP